MGIRHTYSYSKQKNNSFHSISSSDKTNELYSYAELSGAIGEQFSYVISAGANYNNYQNRALDKTYNYVYFRPSVSSSYVLNDKSDFVLNYHTNTITPTLGELSHNLYYKDEKFVYTGSPTIEPYNEHNVSLSYNYGAKQFRFMAEIGYQLAYNPFVPIFLKEEQYIVETFGNIDNVNTCRASTFFQWFPFATNILRLKLYSEVFHNSNRFGEKKWNHTDYRFVPSIMVSYKKWGIQVLYQSKTKILSGQLLTSAPSMAMAEINYRPQQQLTVSAAIRYPFYKAWEKTSQIYASDVINLYESERIKNNANMVYVSFVYSFSFGKTKSVLKQNVNNEDKDSGVLNRIE